MSGRRAVTWCLAALMGVAGAMLTLHPAAFRGQATTVSAATQRSWTLTDSGSTRLTFSTLKNLSSQMEPAQYVATDSSGNVVHTKQTAKNRPPSVTLVKTPATGDQTEASVWQWYQAARSGAPTASRDVTLQLTGATGAQKLAFVLHSAWPSAVDLADTPQGLELTVTFTADDITQNP